MDIFIATELISPILYGEKAIKKTIKRGIVAIDGWVSRTFRRQELFDACLDIFREKCYGTK